MPVPLFAVQLDGPSKKETGTGPLPFFTLSAVLGPEPVPSFRLPPFQFELVTMGLSKAQETFGRPNGGVWRPAPSAGGEFLPQNVKPPGRRTCIPGCYVSVFATSREN